MVTAASGCQSMQNHVGSSRIACPRKPAALRLQDLPPLLFTPDKEIPADNRKMTSSLVGCIHFTRKTFMLCLVLPEPLYCHATHILSFLPNTKSAVPNADRDYLFQKLGDEFTRTQLLEEAHGN